MRKFYVSPETEVDELLSRQSILTGSPNDPNSYNNVDIAVGEGYDEDDFE